MRTTNELATDYIERVNRAIDHIITNLALPLGLDEVAKAARFSPFHFHRIFKAHLGETLNQFVKRQRLERALYLISHAPKRSLTDIALDCGFATSSDFSRSFKQHYGVAEVIVRGDLALEARAIDWLYTTWLPQSRYVTDVH